jgi:hypothetical protein
LADFHGNEAKNIQNGHFKNCFNSSNSQDFFQKFPRLVLGLVGLIDEKGIDMAQSIW